MRPRGELAVVAGVGVTKDGVSQPVASHSSIGARANFLCPTNGRFPQLRKAGIILDRGGHLVVIGDEPHVGADPLIGAGVAVDLMAAIAAILSDELVALDELGRRWLGKLLAGLKIDHLVMTLQAA